jgi:hypothetical protein
VEEEAAVMMVEVLVSWVKPDVVYLADVVGIVGCGGGDCGGSGEYGSGMRFPSCRGWEP